MAPNLERKLTDHRFVISQESLPVLHAARACIEKIQAEAPEIKGLLLFGSRTKGYEVPDSDLDVVICIDETDRPDLYPYGRFPPIDLIEQDIHFISVRQRAKRELADILEQNFSIRMEMRSVGILDISKSNLTRLVRAFCLQPINEINDVKNISITTPTFDLMTLFSLGIGTPVYEARAFVLQQFGKRLRGNAYFSAFMRILHECERGRVYGHGRPDVPQVPYAGPLPQKINQAKKYFLVK